MQSELLSVVGRIGCDESSADSGQIEFDARSESRTTQGQIVDGKASNRVGASSGRPGCNLAAALDPTARRSFSFSRKSLQRRTWFAEACPKKMVISAVVAGPRPRKLFPAICVSGCRNCLQRPGTGRSTQVARGPRSVALPQILAKLCPALSSSCETACRGELRTTNCSVARLCELRRPGTGRSTQVARGPRSFALRCLSLATRLAGASFVQKTVR